MAVSLSDPRHPKATLQILTTTLRSKTLKSMPSCSKASGVFSSRCRYPASSRESHFHRAHRWDSSPVVTPFVRFGTYPKRNCAQTCYNTFCRPKHFCLALYVAIEFGLYLIQRNVEFWHVVSEDFRSRESFLLIDRTEHIVTHLSSVGYWRLFQHLAKFY